MPTKKSETEWSNDPVVDLDAERMKLTPREKMVAGLAEKAKEIKPQRYDITSKNAQALRVVHDYHGEKVAIPPGETKEGILLSPEIADYLGKGDLTLTASAA